MMHILIFCVILLSTSMTASSVTLTPEQALERLQTHNNIRKIKGLKDAYKLAYIKSTPQNKAAVYVFNRDKTGGYLITPADDDFPALLGYSEDSHFDSSQMPEAMKWWLEEYSNEMTSIESMDTDSQNHNLLRSTATLHDDIPILLKTKWSQEDPYNNACPYVGNMQCVTGCVATAMSQVLKYYDYPSSGTGIHEYYWNGEKISYDYSSVSFDWDNMLESYHDGLGTANQKSAVANLMYAAGVSVDMNYDTFESGAYPYVIPYALTEYFGYDKDIKYIEHITYTDEEWEEIIYEELLSGRPVIFGGQATTGGHEFICDGYENGYFHFNWGWGGKCDGYFLLSALNPLEQGTGGHTGGYGKDQHIICNIKKNEGKVASTYPIIATGGLSLSNSNIGSKTTASIASGMIKNCSPESYNIKFSLKITNADGEISYGAQDTYFFKGGMGSTIFGINSLNLNIPDNLKPGLYTVTIAYVSPDGNHNDLPFNISGNSYVEMEIREDGTALFTTGISKGNADISVVGFSAKESSFQYEDAVIVMSIRNDGNCAYNGQVKFYIYEKDTDNLLDISSVYVDVPRNDLITKEFIFHLHVGVGEYDVVCRDDKDQEISERIPFSVMEREECTIKLHTPLKSMVVGEEAILYADIDPIEITLGKTPVWTSSDENIATVDNGKVKAISLGEAYIKMALGGCESEPCLIRVLDSVVPIESISLDIDRKDIFIGDEFKINATILPENATDNFVTWSLLTEDKSISIEDGLVRGLQTGSNIIIAGTSERDIRATCRVVCRPIPESIEINPADTVLDIGEFVNVFPKFYPAKDYRFELSTSDSSIVEVDKSLHFYRAVNVGKAVVTATLANGLSANVNVRVAPPVNKITLDTNSLKIIVGDSTVIPMKIEPEDAKNKDVVWTSSNTNIVSVENGVIKGVSVGSAVIHVKSVAPANKNKSVGDYCNVEVKEVPIFANSINIVEEEVRIPLGSRFEPTIKVYPEDSNEEIVLISSNPSVADIDKNGRTINTNKTGTTVITAQTESGLTDTCIINVYVDISKIEIDSKLTCVVGELVIPQVSIYPDNASELDLTWTTSNPDIAIVDNKGEIKGISPGTCEVTVTTSNGLSSTCIVNVIIPITGITLDYTETTLKVGETKILKATITPENATDRNVFWKSSDFGIVIDYHQDILSEFEEIIRGNSEGIATITAYTDNGISATCEVKVISADVLANYIKLNPEDIIAEVGEQIQLIATILPEDTTNKTISWSSSDSGIATVDQSGLVIINAPGQCKISAVTTDGSYLSAECAVVASETDNVISIMNENSCMDVYTLSGFLLRKNVRREELMKLESGIYIIKIGNRYSKIKIK